MDPAIYFGWCHNFHDVVCTELKIPIISLELPLKKTCMAKTVWSVQTAVESRYAAMRDPCKLASVGNFFTVDFGVFLEAAHNRYLE